MKIVLTKLVNTQTGETFTPPIPVNVTRFFNVDHERASVDYRQLSFAELSEVWSGLPAELADIPPEALVSHLKMDYPVVSGEIYHKNENLREGVESDDWKVYDDSHDRFGWRKPGMHVRRYPQQHNPLQHGPGKRKKGKRK